MRGVFKPLYASDDVQISFIIPAYNAEKVLRRAVESIVKSGYGNKRKDIEVIIIENGSTDSTWRVCEQLTEEYRSVKCFRSNKGVSCARNKGIREAKGTWLVFVDADDYLVEDAVNILKQDIRSERSDLLLYGYESGKKVVNIRKIIGQKKFSENDIEACRVKMLENPTLYMQVWAKVFRRELIIKNKIFFDENIYLSEDSDYTLRYTKICSYLSICSNVIYHYSLESTSVMRTFQEHKVDQYIYAMLKSQKHIFLESIEIQEAYKKYVLMHLNIALVREVFCVQNRKKFKEKIYYMKQIAQTDIFLRAISAIRLKNCCSVRMLPVILLKWHCYFASGIIYQLRAWQNYVRERDTK